MADLKTDYKDELLNTEVNTSRIYNLVDKNGNIVMANVLIQDITQYAQTGDNYGAADINATNEAVNNKLDGSSTVDPMLATEPGFAADAYQTKLQFDEQNKNLESLSEKFLNYEPVDVLSGTVSYVQPKNSCLTQLVTFEKPFGTTPVVTASGYYTSGSTNYGIEPTISEITPVGFKIRDISYMSEVTIVFNWHAYAPA